MKSTASIGDRLIAFAIEAFIPTVLTGMVLTVGSMLDLGAIVPFLIMFVMFGIVIVQIYFMTRGKTIGKAIFGLTVIDTTTGKPLRFWKMLARVLLSSLSSNLLFALHWQVLGSEYGQTTYDMILKSVVNNDRGVVEQKSSAAA